MRCWLCRGPGYVLGCSCSRFRAECVLSQGKRKPPIATSPTSSDGLDGLVTGCTSVTIAAMVGSLLGFLLWNLSPAKVFMDDVGSTFLGAVFAGLVLQAASWPACVPSPPSPSVSAAAPGRLASRPRVPHRHRGHSGAGGGPARGRLALGFRPGRCGAAGWGVVGSAGGGALCCGVPELMPHRWLILGSGGHGRSVADAIRA